LQFTIPCRLAPSKKSEIFSKNVRIFIALPIAEEYDGTLPEEEWISSVLERSRPMAHRRISGSKVRSHKLGIGNSRYIKGKQARLQNRRMLMDWFRNGDPSA
jgi:hypothetical protein